MKINPIKTLLSALTVSFALASSLQAATHPGMLHAAADFTRMSNYVAHATQPAYSDWLLLQTNSYAASTYTMHGPDGEITRTATGGNYMDVAQDAAAAYQNALRWKINGNNSCALESIHILNAWAETCTNISGDSNMYLASGLYGYQLANAAEIMRSYSGWTPTLFAGFQKFMTNVFYPPANDFLVSHNGACATHYWANWDLANMSTVLSIGILCDDATKINQAVNYFKNGVGNGMIDRYVPYVYLSSSLAQGQEAGRDQGHATLDISLVGAFLQMAYNQGQDLFVYNPWNYTNTCKILMVCEYTAKYNLTNSVPYTSYTNCDPVIQTNISSASQGTIRPCWELIYNHYSAVEHMTPTWSGKFAALVRPEGGGGNYGTTSGGFDQLGFGTLTFTQ